MTVHTVVQYHEVPESVRSVLDSLDEILLDVFLSVIQDGPKDLVLRAFISISGEVEVRAFERSVYQKDVLLKNPKDSAEESSFFETLNTGFPDASGFWIVLHVENEDEYLFRMVRTYN